MWLVAGILLIPKIKEKIKLTKKKAIIISVILGVLGFWDFALISNSQILEFETQVDEYISMAKTQYNTQPIEEDGEKIESVCYKINDGEFIGSVLIDYTDKDNYVEMIWLSNGKYYAEGERTDIEIISSDKVASTNCDE